MRAISLKRGTAEPSKFQKENLGGRGIFSGEGEIMNVALL